jgi:hypothetical protein
MAAHWALQYVSPAFTGQLHGGWAQVVVFSLMAYSFPKPQMNIPVSKTANLSFCLTIAYTEFTRRISGSRHFFGEYKCNLPCDTTAMYPPASRNCITLLPLLATATHQDFVSGFCSNPRKSRPSN